jgi:hypothetical protein
MPDRRQSHFSRRSRQRSRTGSKPEPPDSLPEVSRVPTPYLAGSGEGNLGPNGSGSAGPGDTSRGQKGPRRVYLSKTMPLQLAGRAASERQSEAFLEGAVPGK